MRLQVFLSHNGVCSRREALKVIQSGVVTVNGQLIVEPSFNVSEADKISVNGKDVSAKKYAYILLNKPQGYVTSKESQFGQRTVLDLLPKDLHYVAPVGRLDKDTEGLLLLTNDGQWLHQLTHPKFDVDKKYFVRIDGVLTGPEQKNLEKGVEIEGKRTAPCKITELKALGNKSEFCITIHEGKKRQIRLMLEKAGHRVTYLLRMQQGPLKLGDLPRGQWRFLNEEEIAKLRNV
ncbi:MAG: hypothetical protein A2Z88_07755 [Omnitrophica WOR_2 bacterium GWA2_47_8]|nr:MAG: hypothetical protein A2Z88_07755 [Omnitrophica WOR_2 bacterium GWA2_47_8]